MHARELMSSPVVCARPDMPVREAIALLVGHGFAGLPVVEGEDRMVGVLTETDALRCVERGETGVAAGAVMTSPVMVVGPDAEIATIARTMLADDVRCIPVVEGDALVGVVARRDLLRPIVRADDVISAELRALLDDYAAHRSHWAVRVDRGEVTLTGEFFDSAERALLEALARTVPGVAQVRTEVRSFLPASPGDPAR